MTGSPYISVPDPGATASTMSASVQAMKHNVNLLTVNTQAAAQQANLQGAQIFALQKATAAFQDAPTDGSTYGRKNGQWVKVLSPNDNLLTIVTPVNAINDAAAKTAGVPVGGIYRNGSQLMVRVT
jgi:hypothetical protein